MTDRLCSIQCCMLEHHSNKPSSVTSEDHVPVWASFLPLFTWNLSQLLALPSVYRTASGNRVGKQAPLEDGSQMLLFLQTVCASWSAEGICLWAFHLSLLLSLSALHGTALAEPIAWFMAQSPVTSPDVKNESISNLDITQSQIRFGRVCVCVWPSTCARPRILMAVSWSSETICG